jgi:hypothetical protein
MPSRYFLRRFPGTCQTALSRFKRNDIEVIAAFAATGLTLKIFLWGATMKWITRERPKIDRIACPWLVARFVDESPEFLYVPANDVMRVAGDFPGAVAQLQRRSRDVEARHDPL